MKLAVLAALEQRVALRYTMPPMTSQETTSYITHHIKLAGRADTLFSDDATALIHTTARGYPRAVNNLALQALVATYAAGKSIVDENAARAEELVTAARADAGRCARERDDAITAAAQTRHAADTEISRARQAEKDARDQTIQARADAARERDALGEHHQAQLAAAHALTQAERARAERAEAQLETERADRRTLTSHLTSATSDNGQQPRPGPRGGARSK
jgi:hypothetical protein